MIVTKEEEVKTYKKVQYYQCDMCGKEELAPKDHFGPPTDWGTFCKNDYRWANRDTVTICPACSQKVCNFMGVSLECI